MKTLKMFAMLIYVVSKLPKLPTYTIMFTTIFMISNNSLIGQVNNYEKFEDVIYLNDGSIIHGIIIEEVPNQYYKLQTHDGNIYVFKAENVSKIIREPISNSHIDTMQTYSITKTDIDTIKDSNIGKERQRKTNVNFGYGFPYNNDNPSPYFSIEDSYQGVDAFGLNNGFFIFAIDRAKSGFSANMAYGMSLITFDWNTIYDREYTDYTNFFNFLIGGGISFADIDGNSNFGYSTDLTLFYPLYMGGGSIEYDNNLERITIINDPGFSLGILSSGSLFINKNISLTFFNTIQVSKSKDTNFSYSQNGVVINYSNFESSINLSCFGIALGISSRE